MNALKTLAIAVSVAAAFALAIPAGDVVLARGASMGSLQAGVPVLEEISVRRACPTTSAADLVADEDLREVFAAVNRYTHGLQQANWDVRGLSKALGRHFDRVTFIPAPGATYYWFKDVTCEIQRICISLAQIEIVTAPGEDLIVIDVARRMVLPLD